MLSHEALAVAQSNAQRLSLALDLQQGCWLAGVTARFDAIVANPPYIAEHDHHLEALTHEPRKHWSAAPTGWTTCEPSSPRHRIICIPVAGCCWNMV
jgi:release factor glutamine methyltransferase